jgi:hypothetical protein
MHAVNSSKQAHSSAASMLSLSYTCAVPQQHGSRGLGALPSVFYRCCSPAALRIRMRPSSVPNTRQLGASGCGGLCRVRHVTRSNGRHLQSPYLAYCDPPPKPTRLCCWVLRMTIAQPTQLPAAHLINTLLDRIHAGYGRMPPQRAAAGLCHIRRRSCLALCRRRGEQLAAAV